MTLLLAQADATGLLVFAAIALAGLVAVWLLGYFMASDVLAVGFGTTVTMWAAAYVCRLPGAANEQWLDVRWLQVLLVVLLLLCLIGGGAVLGRWTRRGPGGAVVVGVLIALLNIMVLGALLAGDEPGRMRHDAYKWIIGFVIACVVLIVIGWLVGRARRIDDAAPNWLGGLACVAVIATALLIIAGGLVTGADAGLAVPDWPQSEGYNMFFYPLSQMTGGKFYEHAHRLYGSLVGLTTIALAGALWRRDRRRSLRWLAVVAVLAVIIQGAMGGYRVDLAKTGDGIEIARPEHETAASAVLRVAHGVFAQMFLALMTGLAVATSRVWHSTRPAQPSLAAATERQIAGLLTGLLLVQLLVGALVRHVNLSLILHITLAVVVVLTALATAVRAWGLYGDQPMLRRFGVALMILTGVQVVLGVAALIVTRTWTGPHPPIDVIVSTAHQAVGAALLALAAALTLWFYRLLSPDPTAT